MLSKRQLFLLLWNWSKHHDYLDLQQYKQSMLQGGVQFREQVMQIGFSLLVLIEGHKKVLFPKSMVENWSRIAESLPQISKGHHQNFSEWYGNGSAATKQTAISLNQFHISYYVVSNPPDRAKTDAL
jgi:hypothetical protein